MKILAIETSCDETAISLLDVSGQKAEKIKVVKNLVASQIKIHAPFGGVVPNLAKREHLKNLPILLAQAVPDKKTIDSIDLIAVTVGPGLEPALWTGIQFAKELSKKWKKPLIGASHIEGHLYSFLLQKTTNYKLQTKNIFPAVDLVVSGGHTMLVLMKGLKNYKKLGETMDDAVGESFDKVARILNLPYPGGPEVEKMAKKGNQNAINFPSPMIDQKNYNFSYSGLKTSVLYKLRDLSGAQNSKKPWHSDSFNVSEKIKADVAASFQKAAFKVISKKTARALKEFKGKSVMIGGGVAASKSLRKIIKDELKKQNIKANLIFPPIKYCMDNAAMIGVAAYFNYLKKKKYPLRANGILNIK